MLENMFFGVSANTLIHFSLSLTNEFTARCAPKEKTENTKHNEYNGKEDLRQ
jgi:hypothetical protein